MKTKNEDQQRRFYGMAVIWQKSHRVGNLFILTTWLIPDRHDCVNAAILI